MIKRSKITISLLAVIAVLTVGCGSENTAKPAGNAQSAASKVLADKQLESYRAELIEMAFDVAGKIPLEPHIKDRSRAQEAVVALCLELDQPLKAHKYTEKIPNWRRGSCFADLAYYCGSNGYIDKVQGYLDRAVEIAAQEAEGWRRDSIRTKIAQVHALMNNEKLANEYQADVADSQLGKVSQIDALTCDRESFDTVISQLDVHVATGTYGLIVNVLKSYTNLYDRFYADESKRHLIEDKIEKAWDTIPFTIRISTLTALAESAIAHGDLPKASALADEVGKFVFDAKWPARYKVPLIGDFAKLRYKAGDKVQAADLAKTAFELFNAEGEQITNIYRVRALCPLAEAFKTIGDIDMAIEVYTLAAKHAVVNPNSRPQAEDLSVICRSMAKNSVEPSAELWTQIRNISEDLGQPW